ncbi:MAG: methyltransferase domain-containing protein [Candidatus Fermentibacteria bacterium]|nr:methyltransferase domain-containing protein [Candidatus Fermentibacteria bacterium]
MQKRDWSENYLKKMIVEQRKHMWRDDTIEMYSRWMKLRQGMTVVDVGCGLGYLGWTFWKYFGHKGRYFGLDQSIGLIDEAHSISSVWSQGGIASFQQGDAYELPYPDNFADWTMCQTLLMHLEHPEKALKEMIRVTKPGGLIMCNEPDNLSASMMVVDFSENSITDDYTLLHHRMMITWARGRKKLGFGDFSIAVKIPMMMHDLGLIDIDSRCNDTCNFVQPPYETSRQKYRIEMAKKHLEEDEEGDARNRREFKEYFLAGGGSLSSYYRYMKRADALKEEYKRMHRHNIENGTWYRSWGASSFFCIKGRKEL